MILPDDIKLMNLLGSFLTLSTATDSLKDYLKEELTVAGLETTQELKRECVANFLSLASAFEKMVKLSVAINSFSIAVWIMLISNKFVEIKGSAFKKSKKENSFQLSCTDVVDSFQVSVYVVITVMFNPVEQSASPLSPFLVCPQLFESLQNLVVGGRNDQQGMFADQPSMVWVRIGLEVLPPECPAFCYHPNAAIGAVEQFARPERGLGDRSNISSCCGITKSFRDGRVVQQNIVRVNHAYSRLLPGPAIVSTGMVDVVASFARFAQTVSEQGLAVTG
ncbi:hypothetical protein BGZ98_000382 [Dissophora globulifera]|nr:hypothetical protein BGZ98_000382 [Dissophora globulifera]